MLWWKPAFPLQYKQYNNYIIMTVKSYDRDVSDDNRCHLNIIVKLMVRTITMSLSIIDYSCIHHT